ncbi:MAG TPA: HAD-IIB family hydrolase, partial [Polyangiaceae bacterium]|nr:HAD-IIB family hydrolase [Polyangiaceae bacterium]
AMAAEASASLMSILAEHRPAAFVFAGDAEFHDDRGSPFLSYVKTWSREVQPLDDVIEGWSGPVAALVALGTETQIRASARAIGAHVDLQAVTFEVSREGHRGVWGMVVRAAGANKATALAWIAEHHGLSLDEVVAVGDWLNDVPMLRAAGLSFAMGQAVDEVKAAADEVLDADETTGGGIAEAAERAGLL